MNKLLVAAGAVGALALALLCGLSSLASRFAPFDPVAYEREQLAIERMHQLAPLQTLAQAAWIIIPIVAIVGGMLYLASLGVAHVARFRYERQPDAAGLLPVPAAELGEFAHLALTGYHTARIEEARRQLVPASLTYSPSYAPRLDYRGEPERAALPAPDEPAGELASVPTFGDLLSAGRIGRGQPLLLGVDSESGEELAGSWLDLYATATAGLPGSGKTTSQRFFAAQTALHGAQFVVCDPHASAGDDSLAATLEPLRSVYLCEPAEEPKDILQAVRLVADIGENRKRGRDASRTPVILWVDELTGLLGRSDVGADLAELLELIAQEYRKKWVYLSASGQIWTASRTTSELRDSLASVLCHRMKRNQARLLLPTDEAAQVERLATGEAILWRTSGATTRVRIPNTTAADVRQVGGLLGGAAAPAPSFAPPDRRPMGFRPAGANEGAGEGAGEGAVTIPLRGRPDAVKLTPEEAQILAAFKSGKSASDLAAELAGGKKSGDAYKIAARKVAEILRKALAR